MNIINELFGGGRKRRVSKATKIRRAVKTLRNAGVPVRVGSSNRRRYV